MNKVGKEKGDKKQPSIEPNQETENFKKGKQLESNWKHYIEENIDNESNETGSDFNKLLTNSCKL